VRPDRLLAARSGVHLLAMAAGRVIAAGDPGAVITEQTVRDVYGLDSRVVPAPVRGRPMGIPSGRHPTVGVR
ncbi:ABC transporter ATP-binding protein, partial [Rhodococcus sp. IEGM 1404]|nr:ABC transporter ATP-binding protein [Microbacterium sp. IEGM 1404]